MTKHDIIRRIDYRDEWSRDGHSQVKSMEREGTRSILD